MTAVLSLAAALALMTSTPPPKGDTFVAHHLEPDLQTYGNPEWTVNGKVAGNAHVLPDGDILALLDVGGRLDLVRWDGIGHERARHRVALPLPVLDTRAVGADALVVITDIVLAKVDASSGRVLARVPLDTPLGDTPVTLSPNGAWLSLPGALVFLGLDGRRMERPRPVGVTPAEGGALAGMFGTERDECLFAEQRPKEHEVSGRDALPDSTFDVVLTLVSPSGEVLARTVKGELTRRLDWFWIEGSTAGFIPRGAGIARLRYHGSFYIEGFAERADGSFVLVTREDVGRLRMRTRVRLMDHRLREVWNVEYHAMEAFGALPPWAGGILFRSGLGDVRSFAEANGADRLGDLHYPIGVSALDVARTALGRDAKGRWLVVTYRSRWPRYESPR